MSDLCRLCDGRVGLGLAVGLTACVGPVERVTMPGTPDPFVAGYHVYWADASWGGYPLDVLDELYVFELEVGADGRFADAHGWPEQWVGLVAEARSAGVQVTPTVSMHDADAFQELFADAARVDTLVASVTGLLDATPGLSGIHLDFEVFEAVTPASRDGFTAFVIRLAAVMRASYPGKALSAFVLAFDDDDAYNERALGQVLDYLVVQGYDYHSAESTTAGPVGALRGWGRLNWEEVVTRFETFGIPPSSLVMSVPLYGYEWPVEGEASGAPTRGPGVIVPWVAPAGVMPGLPRVRDRIDRHGALRDEESGSPWYRYQDGDGWWQGWYEDAESLGEKYRWVRERGVGGIALFPLVYGGAEIWEGLRAAFPR